MEKTSKYLCVHYLLIPSIHECSDHKLSVFCLDYYPHLVPRRPHLSGTEEPTQAFASNHLNDSKLHVVKSSHCLLPHNCHGISYNTTIPHLTIHDIFSQYYLGVSSFSHNHSMDMSQPMNVSQLLPPLTLKEAFLHTIQVLYIANVMGVANH